MGLDETAPSFRDWLEKTGRAAKISGVANVFVLHSYQCSFENLISALSAWETEQHDGPYFHYFRPVINDYVTMPGAAFLLEGRPTSDYEHCEAAVRSTGQTVCILDWQNPSVLRRVWCMFEASCCLLAGTRFTVIMHPADEARAATDVQTDVDAVIARICSVNAEAAEAFMPSDLDIMQPLIARRPGGHAAVNRLFSTAMCLCVAAACARRLAGAGECSRPCDDSISITLLACTRLVRMSCDLLRGTIASVRRMHTDACARLSRCVSAHCTRSIDSSSEVHELAALCAELDTLCNS